MDRENWRQDPDRAIIMARLGFEIQWYTCDCGAHWMGKHCGPECVHQHRQFPDWDLCNWPPEMLKYWDIRNWRARTPPVDYPDLPTVFPLTGDDFRYAYLPRAKIVLERIDYENKVAYFNTAIEDSK